jgi:predicted ribosome quality control (RQC) complex YloA/Tae2 family protein
MLSLRELRRAARIIKEEFSNVSLRRAVQPDAFSLVLSFEKPADKLHLLISCNPDHARICRTDTPELVSSSNSFCEYLRAHVSGSVLAGIETAENDRQVCLHFQSRNGALKLILSILGTRSNVYLLDADGALVHAMRSLEDTRRELKIGAPWTNPQGILASEGLDRWDHVPDDQYLYTIAKTYQQLEKKQEAELLARRMEQAVKKEKAFLDRKSLNLQEDLGAARQAEIRRRQGELLKNVLHTIRAGDDKASATDYQTGEVLEIPLDPKLSPAANLENYFARYQKELRGVKMIPPQLEELQSLRRQLDSIDERLQAAIKADPPDVQALESLAALPDMRRWMSRYLPKQQKPKPSLPSVGKKEIPTRLTPKRYRTQDGLEIWVGRNDEGNDYLTMRLARGNDLFFHLDGYPGSHVILRTEGRLDPSPRSLLDACELAVHYSKMKNAGSADVHMTPIKNVKKPKGAKPGLVYVRSGRTIRLKREPKRLQEILASRLSD